MNYRSAVTAAGTVDVRTIMVMAHAAAKRRRYDFAPLVDAAYADRFAKALRHIWHDVRGYLEHLAMRAEFAALPVAEQQARRRETDSYIMERGLSCAIRNAA